MLLVFTMTMGDGYSRKFDKNNRMSTIISIFHRKLSSKTFIENKGNQAGKQYNICIASNQQSKVESTKQNVTGENEASLST